MVCTIRVQRKIIDILLAKKLCLFIRHFRTVFNVNLNDIHSYPNDKYELLLGTLNPKWERINA